MTRAREFAHCSTTRTAEAMAKHTETSANLKIELDATMVVWDWLTKENAMVRWFFWNFFKRRSNVVTVSCVGWANCLYMGIFCIIIMIT